MKTLVNMLVIAGGGLYAAYALAALLAGLAEYCWVLNGYRKWWHRKHRKLFREQDGRVAQA